MWTGIASASGCGLVRRFATQTVQAPRALARPLFSARLGAAGQRVRHPLQLPVHMPSWHGSRGIRAASLRHASTAGRRAKAGKKGGKGKGGGSNRGLGIAVFGTITRRYQWKMDLIDAVQVRLDAPAIEWTEDSLDNEALYMQRIQLTGRFLHEHEVFIGPRSPPPYASHEDTNGEKSGWMVFTPFVTQQGLEVIVCRGWVPRRTGKGEGVTRPEGEVTIKAVVQLNEHRNSDLVPDNNLKTGDFFWADIPLFGRRAGFKRAEETALVDLTEPWDKGTFPLPKGMKSYTKFYVTPFKHVVYATTWYSLAVAGTIMTYIKFRR